MTTVSVRDIERFWVKVHWRAGDACWPWIGGRYPTGYGYFDLSRSAEPAQRRVPAHRFAYELFVGPIPEGLQIDHLCRNRACVRPSHLEPVTQKVNLLRGESPLAINARKIVCINGHEFTPENTYTYYAGRRCRACDRDRAQAYRDRKKVAWLQNG